MTDRDFECRNKGMKVWRKASMKRYDIAAYIWPAYTGDEPRTRIFWPEGIGEWQSVKNVQETLQYKPKEYTWNRKPLWGYVNEADPYVMEMEIEAAVDHGVNVFIYDWYWYDNRPFLENCLNDGFLKAKNHDKMKFYLMWANHDAGTAWDRRNSHIDTMIWDGKVNFEQFQTIGKRWIEKYFKLPCYYQIDGKPVISIYEVANFVSGLGGVEQARQALIWLDDEVKKAGFPGVHVQMIKVGGSGHRMNVTGVDGNIMEMSFVETMKTLEFDSCTHYQYVHFTAIDRDYDEVMKDVLAEWTSIQESVETEFYPHISVGWDNNPRYFTYSDYIARNNDPIAFEKALRKAKVYADTYNKVPLITINSWNEWTETSYLEPDNMYGYGYLEAIKRVFVDVEC